MQENIESFVRYFGQDHCYEFTCGGSNLCPEEFSKRMNSCITNFLREVMPDRIGVLEPHKSGDAHQHLLVSLPFTSPNFDHKALAACRDAYRAGEKAESKRLWQKVRASMSPQHSALWDRLQVELQRYGLGKHISLTPVRESARAIASYFGKYLAKGLATRPDAWKNVRLVRYSGTNGRETPPWKQASPLRSSTCISECNRRDKARAVAAQFGCDTPEQVQRILGPQWYFFARKVIDRVQLPVYRSFLHAEADGLTCVLHDLDGFQIYRVPPADEDLEHDDPGDLSKEQYRVRFPDWCYLPWTPPSEARRLDAVTPREAALAVLDNASRFRPAAAAHAALLRTFPGAKIVDTVHVK